MNLEIVQEQKMASLVFFQTVQKCLFFFLYISPLCLKVLFLSHGYELVITLAV